MVLHTMAYLRKDHSQNLNIVVVDGSPSGDETLARGLQNLGVKYLHGGRELSFAESYNAGIKETSNPVVVTLANDVFIEGAQIHRLAAEIRDRVGCAIPYLSSCDYGAQRARKLTPRRCYPTWMTLNVNAFSREVLQQVGLIPEQTSGCFNDVILFIKLRQKDYSIVLLNVGYVGHLGAQTLKSGSSSVSYTNDALLFRKNFPQYWHRDGVLFHRVAQRLTTRMIYYLVEYLPLSREKKTYLWEGVWAIEPYICT
jgi:GT2 family glycosyltransferase